MKKQFINTYELVVTTLGIYEKPTFEDLKITAERC